MNARGGTSGTSASTVGSVSALIAVSQLGYGALHWRQVPHADGSPVFGRTGVAVLSAVAVAAVIAGWLERRARWPVWPQRVLAGLIGGLAVPLGAAALIELSNPDSLTMLSMATSQLIGAVAMAVLAVLISRPTSGSSTPPGSARNDERPFLPTRRTR